MKRPNSLITNKQSAPKMKIAIIGDALDLQYAGIHIYTRELIRNLAKIDQKNEYLLLRPKKSQNEFPNVREIEMPVSNGLHQRARLFTSVPAKLKKEKPDIVFEPGHFGPFNLPKKIKRVTMIHDLTPVLFPEYHSKSSHYFHRLLLPNILKNATHILTNSEHSKKDILQHYPITKNKITAIHLGKDEIFKPHTNIIENQKVLKKYGIQKPFLLHVGTIEPRKNLLLLLEAFEQLKKEEKHKDLKLVLVGKKGWKMEAFYDKLENSPIKKDVIFPGYVERKHLPILYSECQLFVYPSHYEGFGIPIVEAMACGAPVLSSNASCLPEVGGEAASYFSPNALDELLRQMQRVLSDDELRIEIKTKSIKQASYFSWERTARETLAVFESV